MHERFQTVHVLGHLSPTASTFTMAAKSNTRRQVRRGKTATTCHVGLVAGPVTTGTGIRRKTEVIDAISGALSDALIGMYKREEQQTLEAEAA
jgi:hypothetical protein